MVTRTLETTEGYDKKKRLPKDLYFCYKRNNYKFNLFYVS
jgi:hypothetical protein